MSTLLDLFIKHGSDKWEHGYHAVYETLTPPDYMIEAGVFKGASILSWEAFWPNANIVGIDTFERGQLPRSFFYVAGPEIIIGDCRVYKFPKHWIGTFDLIIDDSSHKPRDQAATFRNLWPLLAHGGRYFIEDVLQIDVIGESNLPEWFAQRSADFNLTAFMELALVVQQSRGTVIRHDFRAQSGKPDSVLIEVRKP